MVENESLSLMVARLTGQDKPSQICPGYGCVVETARNTAQMDVFGLTLPTLVFVASSDGGTGEYSVLLL